MQGKLSRPPPTASRKASATRIWRDGLVDGRDQARRRRDLYRDAERRRAARYVGLGNQRSSVPSSGSGPSARPCWRPRGVSACPLDRAEKNQALIGNTSRDADARLLFGVAFAPVGTRPFSMRRSAIGAGSGRASRMARRRHGRRPPCPSAAAAPAKLYDDHAGPRNAVVSGFALQQARHSAV